MRWGEVGKAALWGGIGGAIGGAVFGGLGKAFGLFGKQAFSCNLGPGAIARFAGLNALTGAVSGAMADAAVQLLQTGRIDAGRVLSASIQGRSRAPAGFFGGAGTVPGRASRAT